MTILIQGSMDIEIDVLLDYFKPQEVKTITDYVFYIANYKGNTIIISKTKEGLMNTSVATTIGIYEFKPTLIINQGCAGGHLPEIKNGDLVIGEKSVYINNFYTNPKKLGEGSNSLEWYPMQERSYVVESTQKFVKIAESVEFNGNKLTGILGSGDLWSREADRINYLHSLFNELSEDMESVAALRVSKLFDIDRIAFRIISNNELTDDKVEWDVCGILQHFVIAFINKIFSQK